MASAPSDVTLDVVLGELAAELPAHVRAFARAHAAGAPPPPAPAVARAPATLELARAALEHEGTRARGWVLWRLAAPLAIEDDPRVAAARAQAPSWAGLAELAVARDAAATARLGDRAVAALHRVHGVDAAGGKVDAPAPAIPPAVEGWRDAGNPVDVAAAWRALAAQLGVSGHVGITRGEPARAFIVEPRAHAIVVVPAAVDAPAAKFAALHELGHAACALALPAGTPRVLDEAAAASVARLSEPGGWLGAAWTSPLATAARGRRLAIARLLDAIERALPELPAELPARVPPRALWHDPGAQAAYVAAEALAAELPLTAGAFARALAAARARLDARV